MTSSIPVLVAGGEVLAGEAAILEHLAAHFPEPSDAQQQRAKAAIIHGKRLEQECPALTAPTA
jgi:glutathione S-transferase